MEILNYAENYLGEDTDTGLINNAAIRDDVSDRELTIGEIAKLRLLINPLDGSVFQLIDGNMVRNDNYTYSSY